MILILAFAGCRSVEPVPPSTPSTEVPYTPPIHTPTSSQITQPTLPTIRTPTSTPSLQVDPTLLRGLLLDFWHPWSGKIETTLQTLVEEFNVTNEWGILVRLTSQANPDGMADRVQAAVQAGVLPDLLVGYQHQALTWQQSFELVDLAPYLDDPDWGINTGEQSAFVPLFWEQDIVGEERFGIPALRWGQVLFYNQTWAQELGFDQPPATIEEFRQQACSANVSLRLDSDPGNDALGGWIISTDYSTSLSWLYAFGARLDRGGKVPYQFDTPESRAAFEYLRGLYDQGCAWLPESPYPQSAFAGRLGLFASDSLAAISDQEEAFELAGNRDSWTVLPYPSPDGQPALSSYGPSFQVVASTPERQLAAWQFIKWLLGEDAQARLATTASSFPLRSIDPGLLTGEPSTTSQWLASLALLEHAQPEPPYQSWNLVRWALFDASTQLFRSYFSIDQTPELMELLDATADDLHIDPLEDRFLRATSTP